MRQHRVTLKKQWFIGSKSSNIESSYRFDAELGSGAYGKVIKATNLSSNQQVAIKMVQKIRVKDYKTFNKELSILRYMDHPNIVKILETYETDRICYLVMELCEGGELFDRIVQEKNLSEAHAAFLMRKLFSALSYCHDQGICHRDLKPENLMFLTKHPDSDIKLIDFGLAKEVSESSIMHRFNGTPYYIAPEILSRNYSYEVDCWSLGVIMYVMLSGTPPFNGRNNEEILMSVYNGSYSFRPRAFQAVSNMAKDLIARLLVKDPQLRYTARAAFNHPWIKGLAPLPEIPLSVEVFMDISQFIESENLKKATLMFVASRLSERDIDQLKEVFIAFDKDGDGMLSRSEYEAGLQQSGIYLDKSTLDNMWNIIDSNKNNLIDYTEFLAACLHNQQYLDRGILKTAFEYFDMDGNGLITHSELRSVLRDREVTLTIKDHKVEEMIKEVDRNGDGYIDYQEFLQMMAGEA